MTPAPELTGWWRREVVRPVLAGLGMGGDAAEILVTGTAVIESRLRHLYQIGGPALGPYQVEPSTHRSMWLDWLRYRESRWRPLLTWAKLGAELPAGPLDERTAETLVRHLEPSLVAWSGARTIPDLWCYATAVCRLRYRWSPLPLPAADDVEGLAAYHKRIYNTALGATDPAKSEKVFAALVG